MDWRFFFVPAFELPPRQPGADTLEPSLNFFSVWGMRPKGGDTRPRQFNYGMGKKCALGTLLMETLETEQEWGKSAS